MAQLDVTNPLDISKPGKGSRLGSIDGDSLVGTVIVIPSVRKKSKSHASPGRPGTQWMSPSFCVFVWGTTCVPLIKSVKSGPLGNPTKTKSSPGGKHMNSRVWRDAGKTKFLLNMVLVELA